jgi:hypothetical protein
MGNAVKQALAVCYTKHSPRIVVCDFASLLKIGVRANPTPLP